VVPHALGELVAVVDAETLSHTLRAPGGEAAVVRVGRRLGAVLVAGALARRHAVQAGVRREDLGSVVVLRTCGVTVVGARVGRSLPLLAANKSAQQGVRVCTRHSSTCQPYSGTRYVTDRGRHATDRDVRQVPSRSRRTSGARHVHASFFT
jgi:hypothetical protein